MKQYFSAFALILLACGGSALDVGSSKGGSSSSEEGGKGSEEASGGSFASGGVTMAFGGQAEGARPAVSGGQMNSAGGGLPSKLTGGQPSMGAGGKMPATGGAPMGATGGMGASPGAPPGLLVPQVCMNAGGSMGGTGGTGATSASTGGRNPNDRAGQVWEGDTLDFFFNPQNDKWRLVFDGTDANGRVCGTATYVAAGQAAPPPATDADETYPPSFDPQFAMKPSGEAWPGVTYSIIQGAEVDSALHFRIATSELWQGWCALQSPVPSGDGFGCMDASRGWSSDGVTCTVTNSDGSTQEYPYAKCMLCSSPPVCTCNAEYCAAADNGESLVFDLTVNGTQLTGTVGGTMIRFDLVQ